MKQCSICGASFSLPNPADADNLRETVLCHHCRANLRHQDVASVLLKVVNSKKPTLIDALSEFAEMSMYLLESYGPIYDTLCRLPHFICSEFFEDVPVGSSKRKIRCEDVQNLSFQDNSFDIVITQEIFEHVAEPEKGFSEIHRVLKPGGFHITTIPFERSLDKNRKRTIYSNGEITHLLPPVYHGDAIRSGLVFTDFGLELFDMIRNAGFVLSKYETEYPDYRGGYNCVFICQKPDEHNPPITNIKATTTMEISKNENRTAICGVIAKNYISYTRSMVESFRKYNPGVDVYILVMDKNDGHIKPESENFKVIFIDELICDDLLKMFFIYDIFEAICALKPFFVEYILDKYNISKLLYVDSDILFTADIAEIWKLLDGCSVILTPHLLDPIQVNDRYIQTELNTLRCGIFNGGFLAVANNTDVRAFLTWWKTRLQKYASQDDPPLYADQKWLNLVPGYLNNVLILRDPGYNVAYWNLFNRKIEMNKGKIFVNGFPLRFFHFSGLELENLNRIAKYQDWHTLKDFPALQPVFKQYKESVFRNGYAETKNWPYTYNYFDNGIPISRIIRRIFRKLDMNNLTAKFANPFTTGSNSYYEWLNKDIGGNAGPTGITSLWYEIYLSRPDIQALYPDIFGKNRQEFYQWCINASRQEYGLDDVFISNLHQNHWQVKGNLLGRAKTRLFMVTWPKVRLASTKLGGKYIKNQKILNKLYDIREYLDRKFFPK